MQWSSILWNLLTSDDIDEINVRCETDIGEEMESSTAKKNEQCVTNAHATVMHDLAGPNIALSQIVNCAPVEGQIPVSHTNEPDCKVLPFPKEFPTCKFHFDFKRENPLLVWIIFLIKEL